MPGIMLNPEEAIPILIPSKYVIKNTHEIKIRLSTPTNNDNTKKNEVIEYTLKMASPT